MKFKNLVVLIITLFFIASFTLGTALAGDENDPEVDDDTDETAEPGRKFRDIDAAWFGDETNNTINIYLKLAGTPPGLVDLMDNPDTTTYEYEVYFDVEGVGYAVCAIIQYAAYIGDGTPIGGVYSTTGTWAWVLRQVNYAAHTDIIQSETEIKDIGSTSYSSQNVVLRWTVDKEDIGIGTDYEGRGQELVKTWAAIWNADENSADSQRDPVSQAWDYANTHHSNPGRNYRIKGKGDVDYNIVLSVDNDEKITYGGTPVEFLVRANNNGTDTFTVVFSADYSDEGWTVVLSPNSTNIARGATRTLSVTVTPPKNVENGTVFIVTIGGNIDEIDGNATVPIQDPITLRTIGLTPPEESDGGGWLEDFVNALKKNLAIIAGVIAVIVVAILILAVLIRR